MVAKLTVIFFILLCLMVGVFLTLLPWINFGGIVDWGDNFFLNFVVRTTGFGFLKQSITSGWVRGGVTGLGILNLILAFWELANFSKSVKSLEEGDAAIDAKRLNMNEK